MTQLAQTTAARVAKHREKAREIERTEAAPSALRLELEASTPEWLKYFFADTFTKQWGQVHLDIIAAVERAVVTGNNAGAVCPRGTGKSVILWGVLLKLLLSGVINFPAYLPWAAKDFRKAMRFWKIALCFNQRLAEEYPEVCAPFVKSRGISQRLAGGKWDDGRATGAEMQLSDGLIILPDGRGAIGSSTINGNPRGLNHATMDGKVLRPDFCLVDDAQDKEVAKSTRLVADTIDIIDTDIAGMAGPGNRMPIFILGTVSRLNDVMSHFMARKNWSFVVVPQITSWPAKIELWEPIRDAIADKREPDAQAYYKKHSAELTAGMSVSWVDRYDAARGEPDALYSAMRDFFEMGEAAFMAERQNAPLESVSSQYELTAAMVEAHAIDVPRLTVPDAHQTLVGFIDVNHYGLHWAIAGFDQKMTGHCAAWGRWPKAGVLVKKNATEQEIDAAVFSGLKGLCDSIDATTFMRAGIRAKIGVMLIDVGYKADPVQRFILHSRYSFAVVPSIGRSAEKYRVKQDVLIGAPYEQCHRQRAAKLGHSPYVMFNSDFWRETMQRAFLSIPGAPGGFTLHSAPSERFHSPLAAHVVAERLTNKYHTDAGDRWEWGHKPGDIWDLGDAVTGCWVAAASCGLSTSGVIMRRRRYKEQRKCKVVRES